MFSRANNQQSRKQLTKVNSSPFWESQLVNKLFLRLKTAAPKRKKKKGWTAGFTQKKSRRQNFHPDFYIWSWVFFRRTVQFQVVKGSISENSDSVLIRMGNMPIHLPIHLLFNEFISWIPFWKWCHFLEKSWLMTFSANVSAVYFNTWMIWTRRGCWNPTSDTWRDAYPWWNLSPRSSKRCFWKLHELLVTPWNSNNILKLSFKKVDASFSKTFSGVFFRKLGELFRGQLTLLPMQSLVTNSIDALRGIQTSPFPMIFPWIYPLPRILPNEGLIWLVRALSLKNVSCHLGGDEESPWVIFWDAKRQAQGDPEEKKTTHGSQHTGKGNFSISQLTSKYS